MTKVKYVKINCPYEECNALLTTRYRVDLIGEHKNKGFCNRCHKPYNVIWGDGKIKTEKR